MDRVTRSENEHVDGNNGNVLRVDNNRDSERSQSFTYDPLNRIASAQSSGTSCTLLPSGITKNWGTTFNLDAWGNLLARTVTKCSADGLAVSVGLNNRLNSAGFSYDAAGNLTQNGPAAYVYDAENRLSSTAGVSYTYDGDGVRVKKSNGTLYWGELAESDLAGNISREFISFNERRIAYREADGTVHYLFSDHLGSANVITSATGIIEEESDFYPYGGERVIFTSLANQDYKFTGKERDKESELENMGARLYGSAVGRFTRPDDPFVDQDEDNPQSWNLYTYVRNNPISNTDPTGMSCQVNSTDNKTYDDGDGKGCDEIDLDVQEVEVTATLTHEENVQALADSIANTSSLGSLSEVGQNGIEGAMAAEAIWNIPGLYRGGLSAFRYWRTGVRMSNVRAAGQAGETLAGIVKNSKHINSATGTAAYRIPDILDDTNKIIGEVKNINGKVALTAQIRDDVAFAIKNGYQMVLRVNQNTTFTAPLQRLINSGVVTVLRF